VRLLVQAWIRILSLRQWWRLAGAGIVLATALSVLTASPASAIVVRLANGKQISYEAVRGSTGPSQFDDSFHNVDYSGGPVMPSNTNYVIAWAPSNYVGGSFQAGYLTGVNQFFTDLGHDSGLATNGDSVSTQYNDASGSTAAYQSSFGGALPTDTHQLPTNGCHAANPCITDAQIQTELSSFIASHNLPRDLTHEYFLLTPPNLTSCFDGSGSSPCSANIPSQGYCAYHSASTAPGGSFIYANIPDLAGVAGCDPFFTFCPVHTCNYPNGPTSADGVLSAIDHEHNESITDPEPNNAWTDWGFNNGPEEMADKCNSDAFSDPNLVPQQPHNPETPYNYTINGHHYLLQMMWSNQGHGCLHSFTPNGTSVHASFTQMASSGDSVSFDASASTPSAAGTQYVWQFNTGPGQQQQTNTFETTSPSTSESFPSQGGYVVALTVMAPDGTSYGTAHTVFAVDYGPNPAFNPPTAYAGIPTKFNASVSDPNPGSWIVSYSWDFGDGTTGSGGSAAHTFSRPGNYTVTLTVQDNYFALASVSQDVTVSAVPPPSFVPKSGLARQTIHFGVTGPIPPGTSYSWNFGDGGTGHGAHPTHRYARSGTYRVALTITSSNGSRRTVTLHVRIRSSCRIPNVKGDSLARARMALDRAACRVGRVTHHGHSHITAESPHAGGIVAAGRRVNLTF
jgi:PKD repeat protein